MGWLLVRWDIPQVKINKAEEVYRRRLSLAIVLHIDSL